MSYFPESIAPSAIKSEAADINGNQYVVSASDYNRNDEEIRAIEKTLGVPNLPVPGETATTNPCSLLDVITAMAEQLKKIRDEIIYTQSGVIAVIDKTISPTATIPFPTSWTTTLDDEIPDDSLTDEEELPMIASVTLSSVSGLPTEGYVTIINDMSLVSAPIAHVEDFEIISAAKANGKVGKEFNHEVLTSDSNSIVTVTSLPNGLLFLEGTIVGTATSAGETTAKVKAVLGATTVTQDLIITIADASTPKIINTVNYSNLTVAQTYTILHPAFQIMYDGIPNSITATNLPDGMTLAGPYIVGTPRQAEVKDVVVTAMDMFGDSVSYTVQLRIVDF
jgi:hypothetical protein